MQRIVVWIDCDKKVEDEMRKKVKAALDSVGCEYTLLQGSTQVVGTHERQK